MGRQRAIKLLAPLLLIVVMAGQVMAQNFLPPPEPDPIDQNLFYGVIPGVGETGPVLVFVHGISGTAFHWWEGNDMYENAFDAGYRTAFISLNADNTPNTESISTNAAVLHDLLPKIALHFNTEQLYLIGHSKGGVDIQAAMLDPSIAALVRAVFTISSPNWGTELADWAFSHPVLAATLNLLTPAVFSLRTTNMAFFRSLADPILKPYGIPFYTFSGNKYLDNPLTLFTGAILQSLVPGPGLHRDSFIDGFVTVGRSRLPADYSADLGVVLANHFETDSGNVSFPKIHARIQGLENTLNEFQKIAANGFSDFGGDAHNTWTWSTKWFKGKLYVGTGREISCMSFLTSDVRAGSVVYPFAFLSGQCPDGETLTASLGAEIWRFTPETGEWQRVFKSPETIPIEFDPQGNPTAFTARDMGFRGMAVFTENETEVLYVGGVTSGSVFEPSPFEPDGFPPPRLLRTVDGVNWTAVPQDPGTFLGEIGNKFLDPETKVRSFRSLTAYKGKLFATLGDFVGSGVVVASDNPSAGNDAWFQVSPPRDELPVWTLHVFNDFLYVTTGLPRVQEPETEGYGVYKTDAEGDPPYEFLPIVTNGGNQPIQIFRAPNGLSFAEFQGQLYVGTNRPTELIRINPDDSWDLVVGERRFTPQGFKAPISGFGIGFGNWFSGHFWRMASHGDKLYLGTWDWSVSLQNFLFADVLDKLFSSQYGFDLFRTDDGIHWTAITQTGLGNPNNSGVRSLESTPAGLFIGTERGTNGLEVFQSTGPASAATLAAPTRLESVSEQISGRTVILSWDPSPGAVQYRVYRSMVVPLDELLSGTSITVPGTDGTTMTVTIEEIQDGKLDFLCADNIGDTTLCASVDEIKNLNVSAAEGPVNPAAFPLPFKLIEITSNTAFSEPAPTVLQSIYFVRAEDAGGNLSDPSNIVGGPSKAAPPDITPPSITGSVSPQPNSNGWNNTDVTVTWSMVDPQSGIASSTGCGPVTLTSETAGVTLTCSATNGAEASTSESVIIKIDKTPPETLQQFDPAANDLVVVGRDTLSGVPPGPVASSSIVPVRWGKTKDDDNKDHGKKNKREAEQRTYQVLDLAGNALVLVVKVKRKGHNIKAQIVSLQYGSSPAVSSPWNEMKFKWSTVRTGALKKLNQKMRVGKGKGKQELNAKFQGKKDQTTLKGKRLKPRRKLVRPGLFLPRLATAAGELLIEFD